MESWHNYYKSTGSISHLLAFALLTISLSGCDHPSQVTFQGYVEGDFTYISAESAGKIAEVLVNRGEQVIAGQKLVMLDNEQQLKQVAIEQKKINAELSTLNDLGKGQRPEELKVIDAQIAQAKHDAQIASSKLQRYKKINLQGYVSDFEFQQIQTESRQKSDRVKELRSQLESHKLPSRPDQIAAQVARMETARKQLEKSQVELDKRTLYSIESAIVYDVMYHTGEVVSPGQPILSLLPRNSIKVRFFVPNKSLNRLAIGQKIKVRVDGLTNPLWAEIRFISPKAEYTPPIIYSKDQRERMVFMIEAVPIGFVQYLKLGQPVEVEL